MPSGSGDVHAVAALNALGASACTGGLVLGTLPLTPRPRLPGRQQVPRPRDLSEGLLALLRNPPLRAVTGGSSIGQIGIGALPLLAVLLAKDQHASWAVGGLMTAFAVGALGGSLAYARWPVGSTCPQRVVLVGLLATALPLACVPAAPQPLLAAALFAGAGFCTGPLFSALLAARQNYAPASARSQVFTLGAGLKSAAAALGAAGAGALAGWGLTTLFLVAAAFQLLAGAVGFALLQTRGLRQDHAESAATSAALPSSHSHAAPRSSAVD